MEYIVSFVLFALFAAGLAYIWYLDRQTAKANGITRRAREIKTEAEEHGRKIRELSSSPLANGTAEDRLEIDRQISEHMNKLKVLRKELEQLDVEVNKL